MDFLDCRGVRVLAGADVACREGCLGMVRGSLDRFARDGSWRKVAGFSFIVGKPVRGIPAGLRRRRTIVVGDCAREHRGRGRSIAGCPVPPMSITCALTTKGVWRPLEARLRDLALGAIARALHIPLR